jgi:Raf kinase inhibitor-like YbhB/YbcL family protein
MLRPIRTRSSRLAALALAIAGLAAWQGCERPRPRAGGDESKGEPAMKLIVRSTAFDSGKPIPRRHTGEGEDVSPPLTWVAPPAGTKELALIMDDPDAPSPQPWVHWVLYKIPPAVTSLGEGIARSEDPASPAGAAQGLNSWPSIGYRGPMPPKGHGVHHYHFKLYALDAELPRKAGMDKAALLKAMSGHVLAEGELVGTYER